MPDSLVDRLAREIMGEPVKGSVENAKTEVLVKTALRAAFLEAAKVARDYRTELASYAPRSGAIESATAEGIAARLEEIGRA